jgi:hypothetical protein
MSDWTLIDRIKDADEVQYLNFRINSVRNNIPDEQRIKMAITSTELINLLNLTFLHWLCKFGILAFL